MLVVLCTSLLKYYSSIVCYDKRPHRSHNRGRRPQTRGQRASIDIVKCYISKTNCTTQLKSFTLPRTPKFARLSCGIPGDGRRFATLFECSLNFPSASYEQCLDRQCMHSGRMSQCYKQLIQERLSEKVHATIQKDIVGGFEFTVL